MSLSIRQLKPTDYEDFLVGWWEAWGWTPPPKDFLPEDGLCGIMVMDDEIAVCAGFAYITNSSVAWVDWIVSNPTYRKKPDRKQAIQLLVYTLTKMCTDSGHKYIYAMIKNKSLIETYKQLGYTQGDTYTTEMIKRV